MGCWWRRAPTRAARAATSSSPTRWRRSWRCWVPPPHCPVSAASTPARRCGRASRPRRRTRWPCCANMPPRHANSPSCCAPPPRPTSPPTPPWRVRSPPSTRRAGRRTVRELPRSAHRDRHTRTDPAYAPNAEVFDGLTHDEIFRGVQAMDPGLLSAGAQSWQATATGLGEAVDQAHTEIRGAIADGWRGSAASNAAATVAAFELHGRQLAEVMAVVAQRLERAAEAAETLRAAVGAPSPAQPDLAAALLDPAQATANVETQKAVEGERLDVVRAMDTVYVPAFLGTGVDVPAFPDSAVVGAAAGPTGSQGAGELAVAAGDPGSTVAAQA